MPRKSVRKNRKKTMRKKGGAPRAPVAATAPAPTSSEGAKY